VIRGTDTPFTFKLPYPTSEIEWAVMKFWQDGNNFTPITKTEKDCISSNEYELCVLLTAKETLKFSDKMKAKVQLASKRRGANKIASKERSITVYPICDDLIIDSPLDDAPVKDGWTILDGGPVISQDGDK
jgi:hypothetical protein